MFLAFSSRADETVKLAIRDVLDQFKDRLEFDGLVTNDPIRATSPQQIGKEIRAF